MAVGISGECYCVDAALHAVNVPAASETEVGPIVPRHVWELGILKFCQACESLLVPRCYGVDVALHVGSVQ